MEQRRRWEINTISNATDTWIVIAICFNLLYFMLVIYTFALAFFFSSHYTPTECE